METNAQQTPNTQQKNTTVQPINQQPLSKQPLSENRVPATQLASQLQKNPQKLIEVNNEHLIKIRDSLDYLGKAIPAIMEPIKSPKNNDWLALKKQCIDLLTLSQKIFPQPLAENETSKINQYELEEVKNKINNINNLASIFTDPSLEPIIHRIKTATNLCQSGLSQALE